MSTKSLKKKLETATAKPPKHVPLIPAGMDPPPRVEKWQVINGRYKSFNANAAPLEHLVMSGQMGTRDDAESLEILRVSVARRLVDAFEGAYVSSLKSPDMEPSVSGSGGGRPMSDYKLDCAMTIDRVRGAIPQTDFRIIEGFCYRDEYIWRGLPRKRERAKILMVHKALDRAGVALGMIRADVVKERWSRKTTSKPKPEAKPRPE